jgi:hypothetical protein
MFRCLNCPEKPLFPDMQTLIAHWSATHTVPMHRTEQDPWGQRPARVIDLYEEVK